MTKVIAPHKFKDAHRRNLCDVCEKWKGNKAHAATLDAAQGETGLREALEACRAEVRRLAEVHDVTLRAMDAANPAPAGLDEAVLEAERLAAYRTCRRIADVLRYPPADESGPETIGWNDAITRVVSVIDKKIARLESDAGEGTP